jgi:hypothetical protein
MTMRLSLRLTMSALTACCAANITHADESNDTTLQTVVVQGQSIDPALEKEQAKKSGRDHDY